EDLGIQLSGLDIEAAQDSLPRSFDMSIGRWIRVDGRDGIALLGMLLLTIVSAFGPFGLDILRQSKQRPPTTAAAGEPPFEPNASVRAAAQAPGAQPASGPNRSSTEGQSGQPGQFGRPDARSATGTAQASALGPSGQYAHSAQELGT